LFWTVSGTAGVLALMAGLAATRLATRHETPASALGEKIAVYRATEGQTPSTRLRDPLQRKIGELNDFRNDPGFSALPAEDREYVLNRLHELEDYSACRDKLTRVRLADDHSEAELARLETRLTTGDLALPAAEASEWSQTEAALLRARLLKDVEALRQAVADAEEWYRQLVRRAEELRTFARGKPSDAPSWAEWQQQATSLLGQSFPHAETEELPSSASLTYAVVTRFERVVEARRDWEAVRPRLERLRDLTAALGLAGKLPDGTNQPLDIPEHFAAAQSRAYQERLEKLYPRLGKEYSAADLPDAIASEIRRAAHTSYEHLIGAGREVVLERVKQAAAGGPETPELWRGLREWLAAPTELNAWRVLATLLARIQDPDAVDPITALADFLRLDHFDIEIQRLSLEVPFDRKIRPAGPFTIVHGPGNTEAFVFRSTDDEGRRDPQRRVTVFSFFKEKGGPLLYRPGDALYATLDVKKEGTSAPWRLTWARDRSEVYQFERLVRPPRLHAADRPNTEGELAEDVTVLFQPPGGIPKVPDLMPVVRLKKP
jgi:hypothetical protein